MNIVRSVVSAGVVASLAACFGDGSGNSPAPTPTPTPSVALSATSADLTVDEGTVANFGFTANFSDTGPEGVVPDVTVGGNRYVLDGTPTVSGSTVTVKLKTLPFLPAGKETSTVTFRLCRSADCSAVVANSTKTFTVNLDFKLRDWATFQRENSHSAYVAVNFDPAKFAKAWTWQGGANLVIGQPAATSNLILVSYPGRGPSASDFSRTKALDSVTGTEVWSYDMGGQFYTSEPTIADGRVHVNAIYGSADNNADWVFDIQSGALLKQLTFASQFFPVGNPTAIGKNVFIAQGFYGNALYGYDAASGARLWETSASGTSIYGGESLAADDKYLYFYNSSLHQVDAATGQIVKSVSDPNFQPLPAVYEGGPVLDGKGNVFLFSGPRYFNYQNPITAVAIASGTLSWSTPDRYTTAFALAHDTIYAVRPSDHSLCAISAATGAVLWSKALPGTDGFAGNVVVTENLAFASSDSMTWAIDLKSSGHPVVWTAPTGGRLAITPSNLLLTSAAGQITAYKLN